MITEHHQDQAGLYALAALSDAERVAFEDELRGNAELGEFTRSILRAVDAFALSAPPMKLPLGLKSAILQRIDSEVASAAPAVIPSVRAPDLRFLAAAASAGWKQLPIAGAWIKLLSFEPERGYAVLLGKLDPGTRYPAHVNVGPEDFYIISGDLHVGETVMGGGDFHHAAAGSQHEENHSEAGCTLLAILTTDDPLVAFAMAD